ncbi:hypothetical protein [Pedobacter sp. JY14-1]|uniref:hypothetical protein n=1 Tax=Pedobacter sp. JY14-1 TaxID=3034151 RepID=UPI0023E108D7|nr:hypothetical protein [Pedobacter sp. JY14-1]
MNSFFNSGRFLKLFAKHTLEHYRVYLMALVVVGGILLVSMLYISYVEDHKFSTETQFAFFLVFYLLSGTLFTSTVFSEMGDRRRAAGVLTLPVSGMERYLVAWIYSFVVFQVVFLLCFYAVDFGVLTLRGLDPVADGQLLNVFSEKAYTNTFVVYGILHSIVFLGAISFQRLHFIKTAFAFAVFALVMVVLNSMMLNVMVPEQLSAVSPFGTLQFREIESGQIYAIGQDGPTLLVNGSMTVIVMILWIAAYFKLQEKEV